MTDIFHEREKALETEYIRRKERESLERLREKIRLEESHESESTAAAVRCPRDNSEMVKVILEEVEVDRCSECGGLWLDAGELARLTHRDEGGGFFNRMRRTLISE